MMKPVKVLRRKKVWEMTGIPNSTMHAWIAKGQFPRSILLGKNSVGWIESEIFDWINERIEERDRKIEAKNKSEDCK